MATPAGRRSCSITGRLLLATFAVLLLASCGQGGERAVAAADYDSFFLWAGVEPPAVLDRAKAVYLLAGEVRAGDNRRFVPLRPGTPSADRSEIWLVLRVERIDWQPSVTRQLLAELARWRAAGANVRGVQIDFDSATLGLERYAQFLKGLRRDLPKGTRLSVTGLMDWSAHGDPAALAKLGTVVDEVVVQTYQGRNTIPGYESYLASLSRLCLPYKIALAEGGEWRAPPGLAADPHFKGYVVFLLPEAKG
ncbi:MAG: DUF3142 domain-containing protein [Novosphingobium sp.]|nr:DUF3142 domain-containing protein [Novosphingobium sp.]